MADTAADGFVLAFTILDSLGIRYDKPAVLGRLGEVARGEVTLYGSPSEELAETEDRWGMMSDEERAAFLGPLSGPRRQGMDDSNRLTAIRIIRSFGADPPA